jgi:hypothetical protein
VRVEERVKVIRDEFKRRMGEMIGQLSACIGWIAHISEKIGVPLPSTTQVQREAEAETIDAYIPPPDFHPSIPVPPRHRSYSPPPPLLAGAPVAI